MGVFIERLGYVAGANGAPSPNITPRHSFMIKFQFDLLVCYNMLHLCFIAGKKPPSLIVAI